MPAPRAERASSASRARFSATYSLKARVMESLDQEKPATTKVLSTRLALHQSSVSHALKELMEEDLVTKKGKGYRLSNVGLIQKNTVAWMERTLKCLKDHRDFILSHDLSGIPPGFQVTMAAVCDGREIIEKDPAIPSQIQGIVGPLLSHARHFQMASSTLVPEQQMAAAQAVSKGGSLQTVTTARIIQELRLKSYALKDKSLHSRIELYSRSEINLHLVVTETHLILALPRLDKTYDLENIIISKDPQALEWGRLLFLYFQSSAEKVDLTTF